MTQHSVVRTTAFIAAVAGLLVASSNAQVREPPETSTRTQAPSPITGRGESSTPRFKGGVDLVPLDVGVRDAAGRFMADLSAEDFLILEDGKPQHIAFMVPSDDVPLNVVLLLDISHSMYGAKLTRAVDAAKVFAASLRPDDRLEILAFNKHTQRLHAFEDETSHVASTLARSIGAALTTIGVAGSTALYDALLVGIDDLVRRRGNAPAETRDVVILLSDGEDTSSRVGFEEVVPVVRRSGALVYSVSLRASERGEWLGASWPLLQLARDTGARALGIPQLDALPQLYQEISTEVRHLYRMAYASNNPTRDGRWRTIAVRVPSRDARVVTRAGYYAPRTARDTAQAFGGRP